MNRRIKFTALLFGVLALFAGIGWTMLKSDTIPKGKASFLTMTQALSAAKEAATTCWIDKRTPVVDCTEVRARMPKTQSPDMTYLMSEQGALIGIDHAARVVVILTPHVEVGALAWRCQGSPADAIAQSCILIR